MSYQDKINQFQAGLGSQADAFNSAMNNWKTQTENFAMSKVGAHAEYMAQLGGTIAGASAATHGAFHLAKKAYKARKMKQTTGGNQPEQVSQSTAEHTEARTATNQARATQGAAPEAEGKALSETPMGQSQELRTSMRGNQQNFADEDAAPKPARPTPQVDDDLGDVEGQFSKNFGSKAGGAADDFGDFVARGQADAAQALRAEARPDVDPRFTGDVSREPQASDLGDIQDRLAQQSRRFVPTNEAYAQKVANQKSGIQTTQEGDQRAQSALEDIQQQARDEEFSKIYSGGQDVADTATTAVGRAQEAAQSAGRGYSLLSDVTGGGSKAISGGADAGKFIASQAQQAAQGAARGAVDQAGEIGGRAVSSANDIASAVRAGTTQVASGEGRQGLLSMAKTGIKGLVEKAGIGDIAEAAGAALTEAIPIAGEIAGVGMLIDQLIKSHKEKMAAQKDPAKAGITASASTEQSAGFDPKSLIGDTSASATIV